MPQTSQKYFSCSSIPWIAIAFIISTIYLFYVALISQIIIFHDALGYEYFGNLIVQNGFKKFLASGPHREPLYPLLVALSIKLGNLWRLSYQDVLKFLQVFILIITQILAWRILKILKLSSFATALVILYLGFSPKIVNSAMICYSEIASYPWVLAIILSSTHCLESLKNQKKQSLITWSIILGLSFTGATFTKAAFLLVFPLFMLPTAFYAYLCWKNKTSFTLALIFLMTVTLVYQFAVFTYKLANKKLNGQFAITDSRGSWALFGSTAKRVEPKPSHHITAAIAYATGSSVCNHFFSWEECRYWSATRSDYLGMSKLTELETQGLKTKQVKQELIRLSFHEIFKDPGQYLFLTGVEFIKIFFWDALESGYVIYPITVDKIYNFKPFQNTLYFLMALFSFLSLGSLLIFLVKKIHPLFGLSCNMETLLLSQSFMLIICYGLAHILFFIDPRHILPIGPAYVLMIAWMINSCWQKISRRPSTSQ